MKDFEDIRPYNDAEVPAVIDRMTRDPEFHQILMSMKFPKLKGWLGWPLRRLIKYGLRRRMQKIKTVEQLQDKVVEYLEQLLADASSGMTVSGLDKLDPNKPNVFIGNHRDIAMDPALVSLALHYQGRDSVRIAIGDNLLTKPFASDLMRLNKSFIVKRSVEGRRDKFNALKQLSSYIRHSLSEDQSSIWIAQREGRAKDGIDKTDTALIKMLMLSNNKDNSFQQGLAELNLVPVAISYEFDPCDQDKARELHAVRSSGAYEKGEHEDLMSIYRGMVGEKGHVHVAFGEPITELETPEQVAAEVDRQIYALYKLQTTNLIAYEMVHGANPLVEQWKSEIDRQDWEKYSSLFLERINGCDESYRDLVLAMYANPVCSRLAQVSSS